MTRRLVVRGEEVESETEDGDTHGWYRIDQGEERTKERERKEKKGGEKKWRGDSIQGMNGWTGKGKKEEGEEERERRERERERERERRTGRRGVEALEGLSSCRSGNQRRW